VVLYFNNDNTGELQEEAILLTDVAGLDAQDIYVRRVGV
jgi:hypothetical protein